MQAIEEGPEAWIGPNNALTIVYNAKTSTANGWNDRAIFAQPAGWNADGTPAFGIPSGYRSYDEAAQLPC